MKGAVPLGDVAAKAAHLEVACTRCDRRGRYVLARLVQTYGPEFPMTALGAELTDCPNRGLTAHDKRCDIYFPGLPEIMNGEPPGTP